MKQNIEMVMVFLAGSRKFSEEINWVEAELKKKGTHVLKGRDPATTEKNANKKMFERIDASDIVYIVAKAGYIGLIVALEIGYAYAKKKEIIASEPFSESEMNSLVSKVLGMKEFTEYVKIL